MLQTVFGQHVIHRALNPMQSHGAPGLLGYLPSCRLIFRRFSSASSRPISCRRRCRPLCASPQRKYPFARLFLLSWIVPGFVMFHWLRPAAALHRADDPLPLRLRQWRISRPLSAGTTSASDRRWLYILQIAGLAAALMAVVGAGADIALEDRARRHLPSACIGFAFRISLLHRLSDYEQAMRTAGSVFLLMESMFPARHSGARARDIKLSKPVAELLRKDFKRVRPSSTQIIWNPAWSFISAGRSRAPYATFPAIS